MLNAIILAAGKGTRLKSRLPKVLHPLFGKPLLQRVCEALEPLGVDQGFFIVGHGREQVQKALDTWQIPFKCHFITQEPQLGTGHALLQVKLYREHSSGLQVSDLPNLHGTTLILSGDVPLLRTDSLQTLANTHLAQGNDLTLMVADLGNPTGYGRVVLQGGRILKIVEERDATPQERDIRLVNAGIYCAVWERIEPLLDRLSANNAQQEFYLTDLVALASQAGLKIGFVQLDDPQEMTGVNSREELALCHEILNCRTQSRLMRDGVTILDPRTTMIGPEVQIGLDTVILPGCFLQGDVQIGEQAEIGPNTTLMGPIRIGKNSKVVQSYLKNVSMGEDVLIGPFAHLRDGAVLSHHVRIGNFVEVKNARIDHHSNAAHLCYLGDAALGSEVNMGAGSITANYDPIRDTKHETIIGDGVKVGCNAVLVAPVQIHERACVAAGSVITQDVAPWDLAIARPRQTAIPDWVKRISEEASAGGTFA